MELTMTNFPILGDGPVIANAATGVRKGLMRVLNAPRPMFVGSLERRVERHKLDHFARCRHVQQVFTRDGCDTKPALRLPNNQAGTRKLPERIAQRAQSNSIMLGKISTDEFGSGRQSTGQDIGPQKFDGFLKDRICLFEPWNRLLPKRSGRQAHLLYVKAIIGGLCPEKHWIRGHKNRNL